MSLWTPSGEHHVAHPGRVPDPAGLDTDLSRVGAPAPSAGARAPASREEEAPVSDQDVDTFRRQLADAPADVVVANHCYGLFELAALYLSESPPRLEHARLAIDALGAVVGELGPRLKDAHAPLRDALAQIRLAYVQIGSAADGSAAEGSAAEGSAQPTPEA